MLRLFYFALYVIFPLAVSAGGNVLMIVDSEVVKKGSTFYNDLVAYTTEAGKRIYEDFEDQHRLLIQEKKDLQNQRALLSESAILMKEKDIDFRLNSLQKDALSKQDVLNEMFNIKVKLLHDEIQRFIHKESRKSNVKTIKDISQSAIMFINEKMPTLDVDSFVDKNKKPM